MSTCRIALANLRRPETPGESVELACAAIREAARAGAEIVCFPECYVPGYRWPGRAVPPPDRGFLEHAWQEASAAAKQASITVILGSERFVGEELRLTAVVIGRDGSAAFQDKVQLDPSEEAFYRPGTERRLFQAGALTFGVVICHEGWRYPETVRWAARRGAQVVFHSHYAEAEPGGYVPTHFRDPRNSFHESAILCRAAENTCYFASVNCASKDAPITSAIAAPDGTLVAAQLYGEEGLLSADLDLARATGLLARRLRE